MLQPRLNYLCLSLSVSVSVLVPVLRQRATLITDTRPFAPDSSGNISASLFSAWNETLLIQKNVYSDGLHLTAMGYDVLGEMVFLTLRDFQVAESPEADGEKCALLES